MSPPIVTRLHLHDTHPLTTQDLTQVYPPTMPLLRLAARRALPRLTVPIARTTTRTRRYAAGYYPPKKSSDVPWYQPKSLSAQVYVINMKARH